MRLICVGSAARPIRARSDSASSSSFRCDLRQVAALAGSVLAVALLIAPPPAAAAEPLPREVVATAATIRDFLIQNVCLDARGAVLAGVSPVDGNPACRNQRDLRPGERLPYHKHDHPNQGDSKPLGYQRHDSYPIETAGFGEVVEHSFDFGGFENRRFGVFDRADGGDIAVLSPGRVSFAATEDGGAGFQLFVGECSGPVTPEALTHSWIVVEFPLDGKRSLEGETIARLNDLTAGHQETCPSRFNPAYTRWHVAPFRYRAMPGQGAPMMLTTLISDHYGGAGPSNADHVERFYFTRELGGTRWERWQNANGNRQFSAATVADTARAFAATGRCSEAPVPEGGAPMVLIDCREWSRIVPPSDPAGDPSGFFIEELRSRAGAPGFFAPPEKGR
jgi:hypothetical protein